MKQCGRVVVPAVERPRSFADAAREAAGHDLGLAVLGGRRPDASPIGRCPRAGRPARLLLLVGPEGGFTRGGGGAAERSGARLVSLGPRILRAESAGLAAVALCQYRFGDLGGPTRVRRGRERHVSLEAAVEGYEYFDVAADVGVHAWGQTAGGVPPAVRARACST